MVLFFWFVCCSKNVRTDRVVEHFHLSYPWSIRLTWILIRHTLTPHTRTRTRTRTPYPYPHPHPHLLRRLSALGFEYEFETAGRQAQFMKEYLPYLTKRAQRWYS